MLEQSNLCCLLNQQTSILTLLNKDSAKLCFDIHATNKAALLRTLPGELPPKDFDNFFWVEALHDALMHPLLKLLKHLITKCSWILPNY